MGVIDAGGDDYVMLVFEHSGTNSNQSRGLLRP